MRIGARLKSCSGTTSLHGLALLFCTRELAHSTVNMPRLPGNSWRHYFQGSSVVWEECRDNPAISILGFPLVADALLLPIRAMLKREETDSDEERELQRLRRRQGNPRSQQYAGYTGGAWAPRQHDVGDIVEWEGRRDSGASLVQKVSTNGPRGSRTSSQNRAYGDIFAPASVGAGRAVHNHRRALGSEHNAHACTPHMYTQDPFRTPAHPHIVAPDPPHPHGETCAADTPPHQSEHLRFEEYPPAGASSFGSRWHDAPSGRSRTSTIPIHGQLPQDDGRPQAPLQNIPMTSQRPQSSRSSSRHDSRVDQQDRSASKAQPQRRYASDSRSDTLGPLRSSTSSMAGAPAPSQPFSKASNRGNARNDRSAQERAPTSSRVSVSPRSHSSNCAAPTWAPAPSSVRSELTFSDAGSLVPSDSASQQGRQPAARRYPGILHSARVPDRGHQRPSVPTTIDERTEPGKVQTRRSHVWDKSNRSHQMHSAQSSASAARRSTGRRSNPSTIDTAELPDE